MMKLTEDDYQDAIDLNYEQALAFAALRRAVKRCRDTNIYFYQCLDTLGALNGDNVSSVICNEDHPDGNNAEAPDCLQCKHFPSVTTDCSFADDNHFVVLRDSYKPPQED